MPKLYLDRGRFVVPGKQGRHADRVDVPNKPEALATWLNDFSGADREPAAETPPPGPPAPATAPLAVAPALTLTDVEEFIQAADAARLASLASNVCYRMAELARGLA